MSPQGHSRHYLRDYLWINPKRLLSAPRKPIEAFNSSSPVLEEGVENFADLEDGGLEKSCTASEVGFGMAAC